MRVDWFEDALDEICWIDYGTRVVRARDEGKRFPVYGGGGATFFIDQTNRGDCYIVSRFGMSEQCVRFVSGEFYLNDSGLTVSTRDSARLRQRFLDYQLVARQSEVYALSRGTAQRNLDMEAFRSLRLTYPASLAEQDRIVTVLDEALEAITIAIANTKTVREKIGQIITDVTDTVGEWTFLSKEVDLLTGFAFRSGEYTNALDGIRLLRGDNVVQGRLRWEDVKRWPKNQTKEFSRFQLNPDDVVIAMDRPWTKAGLKYARLLSADTPSLLLQRVARLRAKPSLKPSYLELVVSSPAFEQHVLEKAGGSGVPHISGSQLGEFQFRLPTLDQQQALIEKASRLGSGLDALRSVTDRKLTLLAEFRTALLARAFSGELTAAASPLIKAAPANDNAFTTPEQVANVIAFAQRRHVTPKQQLTFGHKKAQKALQLIEAVGGVELGRRPDKDAAGPNDFQHMLAAERWAKANDFFEFINEGGRYTFRKLGRYAERMRAADAALTPVKERLDRATALVVELDSTKAEVLATVHAAWNNLILDGEDPTEEAIVRTARDEWHPDKLLIPVSEFRHAIREIRRLDIVPDGSAKRVGEPRLV